MNLFNRGTPCYRRTHQTERIDRFDPGKDVLKELKSGKCLTKAELEARIAERWEKTNEYVGLSEIAGWVPTPKHVLRDYRLSQLRWGKDTLGEKLSELVEKNLVQKEKEVD